MPIVTGGRREEVLARSRTSTLKHKRSFRANTLIQGEKLDLEIYRREQAAVTLDDVTLIREQLGLNTSEALRFALRVLANALRKGRFNVEPERTA